MRIQHVRAVVRRNVMRFVSQIARTTHPLQVASAQHRRQRGYAAAVHLLKVLLVVQERTSILREPV